VNTGDRHFFELAATIIPLILFGSVLARSYQRPDIYTRLRLRHKLLALCLVVAVIFVCSAEILAIAVAVGGGATGFIAGYISIAVVVAVFGFGVAVLAPWAIRFHREGQFGWLVVIVAGVVLLAALGSTAVKLERIAHDAVLEEQRLSEFSHATHEADAARLALIRAQIAAHANQHVSGLEQEELEILRRQNKAAQALFFSSEP
jgi:NADH:ubiquinone oxidoreductase subunit 3 (subunit A)